MRAMKQGRPEQWFVTIARSDADAWHVAVSNQRLQHVELITFDPDELEATVTKTITEAVSDISDLIWRHELAALAYQEHSRPLAMAQQLTRASATLQRGRTLAAAQASKAEADRVAFAVRALLGRHHPVVGVRTQIAREKLRWIFAASIAWPAVVGAVLRYGGSSPRQLQTADVVHAVHGEWETRTRHLLPPRYDPGPDPIYLIIGRPRQKLSDVAYLFLEKARLRRATLLRPIDLRAASAAIGPGLRQIAGGLSMAAKSPVQSGLRDAIAITYRMMQGSAHRQWWRRRAATPQRALFGHTGTADTSQLELEMQADGTETVHVAHGINHGWPFAGLSSLGLFQSQYDAELAEKIGAYLNTACVPSSPPVLKPDGKGWLILTSYTHPMGRPYAQYGVAPDLKALNLVAEAAQLASVSPGDVMWRPHPAIEKVRREDRDTLNACAARHGFKLWPQGLPLEALQSFAVIVTTPSTVLVDALNMGKCPILVATAPLQKDLIYAAYPLRAQTADDLHRHSGAASVPNAQAELWRTYGPAQSMTSYDPTIFQRSGNERGNDGRLKSRADAHNE